MFELLYDQIAACCQVNIYIRSEMEKTQYGSLASKQLAQLRVSNVVALLPLLFAHAPTIYSHAAIDYQYALSRVPSYSRREEKH